MTPYDPALLDVPKLEAWLAERELATAVVAAETLTGGRSNVMFTLEVETSCDGLADATASTDPAAATTTRNWVLRRPATVAIERANDGMRREFRILSALDSTDAPHPPAVALCEDLDVLGCVFFLMEQVDGFEPGVKLPDHFTQRPNHQAELAQALVEALAALHNVPWQQVGLADFGKPDGFHERQVERWGTQLASYEGRDLPELTAAGEWLQANLPQNWSPTIMHGDYHLFNILLRPEPPPQVAAIVDWETATIGDPLLDFVGFCEAFKTMRSSGGWPSYAEMLAAYLKLRPDERHPSETEQQYYGVLYNFRMAVLLEGIYQRSLLDPNRPDQDAMGERALFNAARCQEILANPECLYE